VVVLVIRTYIIPCQLPRADADALNRESGRIYSQTLIWQYRIYRRKGIWLSPSSSERLGDFLSSTTLHTHSRDAAQQAFHKACKTAKANRGMGAKYPHKRKFYRTTVWKDSGIRLRDRQLLLARARGLAPIVVQLPEHLAHLSTSAFREARLVYDRASRRYQWHLVIENGAAAGAAPGARVAAVDLGEVHPAALTNGEEAVVISLRALRSSRQYTAERLSELRSKQDHLKKRSRRHTRLQQRKARFLAKQARRTRDLEHKASRAAITWASERGVGTLAIGDVRSVADGKRMRRTEQQKIGLWSHGRMRSYLTYKAAAAGIAVAPLVDEHYTTQTCPICGLRSKPKGRSYSCRHCGFRCHRDVVGAANILSRHLYDVVGKVVPPAPTYRHPFVTGKRSRLDTAHVACGRPQEAAGL
jgi:putative transposase